MTDTINVGLSSQFKNKDNISGKVSARAYGWVACAVTIEQFAAHVTGGKSWAVGTYARGHRAKDNFIQSQVMALDCDDHTSVADALADPLVRTHAAIVHPSPSSTEAHPKTRVIFILDQPITGADQFEAYAEALIDTFAHLRPDKVCKNAARNFYGSTVPGAYIAQDARLPLALVGQWERAYQEALEAERADAPTPRRDTDGSSGELSPALVADVVNLLGVSGTAVNSKGFSKKAVKCLFKTHEHDDSAPGAYWNFESKSLFCHKCGEAHNTHEVAERLGINPGDYYRREKGYNVTNNPPASPDAGAQFIQRQQARARQLDALYPTPDETFNRSFVETIQPGDVIVDSPLGTGKSTAIRAAIKPDERVIAINDRRVLVKALARDLEAEVYDNFEGQYRDSIQHAPRLAITVDSVYRLAGAQAPDVLVLEEVDYVLRQLSASSMKPEARDANATVLRYLIENAGRVIAVQANVSPIAVKLLKELRPGIRLVKNTYTPDRDTVSFVSSTAIVTDEAINTAQRGGFASITSDSRTLLQGIEAEHPDASFDLLAIHAWKTQEPETQQLVMNINQHLTEAKARGRGVLVLMSPSAAVGFNVDSVTFDFVGTIAHQKVTPETLVQMNMRIRHAQRRAVFVPGEVKGSLPTNADDILADLRAQVAETVQLADFQAHGIPAATEMQAWITKIDAAYTALDNLQKGDMIAFTAAYFARSGFLPVWDAKEATDGQQAAIKAIREGYKEYRRQTIHSTAPITRVQFDHLREAGHLREIHFYGRERSKIETVAGGRDINTFDHLYGRFDTPDKRKRIYRAEMLTFNRAALAQRDRDEAAILPKYRRNYVQHFDFFNGAWSALMGQPVNSLADMLELLPGRLFTEDDTAALKAYCVRYGIEKAERILNYTRSATVTDGRRIAAGLFHALLRSIYLHADRFQARPMVDGRRISVMSYRVNAEAMATLQDDLRHLQAARMEVSTNSEDFLKQSTEFVDTPENTPPDTGNYERWKAQIDSIPI